MVLLEEGEGGAGADDAAPLVLTDLVAGDVVAAVEHDDAVAVLVNVIMFDPAEPRLDAEDALRSRLVNQVVEDHGVGRVVASVGDVGFVILENSVFLNVP